jgi:transcriptional regulator with XRE-family HTH domain
VRRAVADRNANALIRLLLRHTHLAQDAIARMCDLSQAMVSRVLNGNRELRKPETVSRAFEGITHGYDIPTPEMARVPAELALGLNDSGKETASVLRRLARADVDHTPGMEERADASSVSPAVLAWLVRNTTAPSSDPRFEEGAVAEVRATTAALGALDNRFGGEKARTTAVHYLNDTIVPLLRQSHAEAVQRSLFTVTAEFVLSIAWMSYDAQRNGAARRYFVQALDLATHAEDRSLGASVLSAMSHQANYLGAHREARDLARAALTGAGERATATMRAQFLMMEPRAHAARRDKGDCFRAMSEAERAFGARQPDADPEWIRYFVRHEAAWSERHMPKEVSLTATA